MKYISTFIFAVAAMIMVLPAASADIEVEIIHSFEHAVAYDINNSTQIVGTVQSGGITTPMIWDPVTGITLLPGATGHCGAFGVNNNSESVGRLNTGSGNPEFACLWEADTTLVPIGIPAGDYDYSTAHDANDAGVVALYATEALVGPDVNDTYVWDAVNGFTMLPHLSWNDEATIPYEIGNNGWVAGTSMNGYDQHAVYWDENGNIHDLGMLNGMPSKAWGLNDHGQVVGQTTVFNSDAWIWDETNGMVQLQDYGYIAVAYDINNNGWIVGYADVEPWDPKPVVWDPDGNIYNLQELLGYDEYYFYGDSWFISSINDKNEVYATAYSMTTGNQTVVVIALPPEPVELPLDIKPGSCPNPLNIKGNGKLPVAILGTEDFDVMDIDPNSITIARADGEMGSAGVNVKPNGLLHFSYEDVGTPYDGDPCGCHEMGGDGYMDLSIKFNTQDLVAALALDTEMNDTELELVVSGTFMNGLSFETTGAFEARDCLLIKGNNDLFTAKSK